MNPIIMKVVTILKEAGKLQGKYPRKINIEINMNDGGVSEATLSVTERLK